MRVCLPLVVVAGAMICDVAVAEPTIIEDTDAVTVFRERDQVVVLAADGKLGQLVNLSQERAPRDLPKVLGPHRIDAPELRDLGAKVYITRIRQLDNELVCEKLTARPQSREDYRAVVDWLLEKPC